jgi:hypothetical protein
LFQTTAKATAKQQQTLMGLRYNAMSPLAGYDMAMMRSVHGGQYPMSATDNINKHNRIHTQTSDVRQVEVKVVLAEPALVLRHLYTSVNTNILRDQRAIHTKRRSERGMWS